MKNLMLILFAIVSISLIGCEDDEAPIVDDPMPTGEEMTFDLGEADVEGISGMATFIEYDDGSTLIELDLEGTPEGGVHPAHIHSGAAAEGLTDNIEITLESVDGDTGMSETWVTEESYEDLINYDGYINVHLSEDDLATLVAQGDIGVNVLTGEEMSYDLVEVDGSGVMGTALFQQRENGETLLTIDLEGTVDGGMHPSHIHEGESGSGGPIAISLTDVDGATGMSMTNISNFNDDVNEGEEITYTELLEYAGYINVHLSSDDLATVVATGNIGASTP